MKQRKPPKLPRCFDICFDTTGSRVVVIGYNVMCYETNRWKKNFSIRPIADASRCDISQNGNLLAVKNTAGRIVVVDMGNGKLLNNYENKSEGEGSPLKFVSDGKYLVDGSWRGHITVRASEKNEIIFQDFLDWNMITYNSYIKQTKGWLFNIQPKTMPGDNFEPDQYLVHWKWPFWENHREKYIPFLPRGASVSCVPNSNEVAIFGDYSREDTVRFYKLGSNEPVKELIIEGAIITAIYFSPKGKHFAITTRESVFIYDFPDFKLVRSIVDENVMSVAFSPTVNLVGIASTLGGKFEHY